MGSKHLGGAPRSFPNAGCGERAASDPRVPQLELSQSADCWIWGWGWYGLGQRDSCRTSRQPEFMDCGHLPQHRFLAWNVG